MSPSANGALLSFVISGVADVCASVEGAAGAVDAASMLDDGGVLEIFMSG